MGRDLDEAIIAALTGMFATLIIERLRWNQSAQIVGIGAVNYWLFKKMHVCELGRPIGKTQTTLVCGYKQRDSSASLLLSAPTPSGDIKEDCTVGWIEKNLTH